MANRGAVKGFTVVELLVVIVVISILTAITVVSYTVITDRAKLQTAKTDAQTIATRLNKTKADTGSFPTTQASFNTLGITQSTQSTFTYVYNSTAGTYCVTATNATKYKAYVTSVNLEAVEGTCP